MQDFHSNHMAKKPHKEFIRIILFAWRESDFMAINPLKLSLFDLAIKRPDLACFHGALRERSNIISHNERGEGFNRCVIKA